MLASRVFPDLARAPHAERGIALGKKRKLFIALCRSYGLEPFREPVRRYSTLQLRAPKEFHERTLWPEFLALCEELHAHLDELTTRVIREAINDDVSEPAEAPAKALPAATHNRGE